MSMYLDDDAIFCLVHSGFCSGKVWKNFSVGLESSCAIAKVSQVSVVSGVCCSCSVSVVGALNICLKSRVPKVTCCSVGSPPTKLLLRRFDSSLVGVTDFSQSLGSLGGLNDLNVH